jgi:putative membrane protein
MAEPLIAYLHYLSIIVTGGFLVGELLLCRPGITPDQVRRLPIVDVVFFVSALVALASGLLRLFFYAKGIDFYVGNPFFWLKMALYVAIALLSIRPTRAFIRWKRTVVSGGTGPTGTEIATARRFIHLELGLLALMPLMAVLMARGLGR